MKSDTICTSALVPMRGAPWAEELARPPGGKAAVLGMLPGA